MSGVRSGKELDPYLRARIGEARFNLEQLIKPSNPRGTKRVYYLGNFRKDVLDNFTEKQSEKIFKTMSKYMNNNDLQFFQKKNKNIEIGTWSEYGENEPESISSYDYIVIRRA